MYRLPPSLESIMILHFTVCTLSTPLARGSITSQIVISHVHKCSTSAIDSHSHSNAYPFITWMERSNEGKIPCSRACMPSRGLNLWPLHSYRKFPTQCAVLQVVHATDVASSIVLSIPLHFWKPFSITPCFLNTWHNALWLYGWFFYIILLHRI